MSVFGMAAMSTGFFALVPVRLVAWPVAPACSLVSYLLLLAIAGPTDQDILLWSLGALVLAFCLPLGSFRDRELHERELWLAGRVRARLGGAGCGRGTVVGGLGVSRSLMPTPTRVHGRGRARADSQGVSRAVGPVVA